MDLSGFRDPAIARNLIEAIQETRDSTPVKFMEVCGTHTVSIAKHGLRDVMPENDHAALRPRLSRLRHEQRRHRHRDRVRTPARRHRHHVRRHDEGARLLLLAVCGEGRRARHPRRLLSARRARDRREEPGQAGRLHRRRLRDDRPRSSPPRSSRPQQRGIDELLGLLGTQDRARRPARARQRPRRADRRVHPARSRLHDHRPGALPSSSPRSTACPA